MQRLAGFSDVALLATVAQIDTFSMADPVGERMLATRVTLQVERQFMGPAVSAPLLIGGPDVLATKNENNPILDPFTYITRDTGIRPGARGIYMLRVDPRNRLLQLVPGGVFEVKNDTIVVESRWGGRRWAKNVAKPLVDEGVDVGAHIQVDDVARWLELLQQRRLMGLEQRRATFVAEAVLLGYMPLCNLPPDVRCFRMGVTRVFQVDRDSLARCDTPRDASPFQDTDVAQGYVVGAQLGQPIKVMLPGYFVDWIGQRVLLLLEPGPAGSNIWIPAYDGFGAQPVQGDALVRTALKYTP